MKTGKGEFLWTEEFLVQPVFWKVGVLGALQHSEPARRGRSPAGSSWIRFYIGRVLLPRYGPAVCCLFQHPTCPPLASIESVYFSDREAHRQVQEVVYAFFVWDTYASACRLSVGGCRVPL